MMARWSWPWGIAARDRAARPGDSSTNYPCRAWPPCRPPCGRPSPRVCESHMATRRTTTMDNQPRQSTAADNSSRLDVNGLPRPRPVFRLAVCRAALLYLQITPTVHALCAADHEGNGAGQSGQSPDNGLDAACGAISSASACSNKSRMRTQLTSSDSGARLHYRLAATSKLRDASAPLCGSG